MQIIAILIGLVLLAAIAFYVSRPIVQHRRSGLDVTVMTSLEAQRDGVYSQIRELDMDHATGKMNDEDYQQARAELVAQAANLLRQIDGALMAPITPVVTATASATLPVADDVEALIAARRKTTARPSAPAKPASFAAADDIEAAIAARRKPAAPKPMAAPATDDVEALIAARRKPSAAAPVAQLAACPNCSKPITSDDAFCSKCGTPLKAAAR